MESNKLIDFENQDIGNISETDLRDIFETLIEGSDMMTSVNNTESNTFNSDNQTKKVSNNSNTCSNCNKSDSIVHDMSAGCMVCTHCGQVVDAILDNNPEWKQFDDNDNSRCSMPINHLLPQSSLGTNISGGNWKSRIKTLHRWSQMPYRERSLNLVFKEIQNMCNKANLLKCIEDDAKIMYKSISECKHLKGKNIGKYIIIRGINRKSLIAACVFFACKRKGMTRSPKEIADLFKIKYTDITKGCKNFLKLTEIKKMNLNVGTSLADHFVARFCNELHIKTQYMEQAQQIAKNIVKLNIASDHTPFSLATTSILLMADINNISSVTKKKLSDKFGVSEVTVAKTFKKIEDYKNIITNDKLVDKAVIEINEKMKLEPIPDSVKERCKKFGIQLSDNSESVIKEDLILSDNEELIQDSETLLSDYDELNFYINDEMTNLEFGLNKAILNHNDIVSKYNSLNKSN